MMKKRFKPGKLTSRSVFARSALKTIEYIMAAIVPIEAAASSALIRLNWIEEGYMEEGTRKFFILSSIAIYSSLINASNRYTILTEIRSHKAMLKAILGNQLICPPKNAYAPAGETEKAGQSDKKLLGKIDPTCCPMAADIESCRLFSRKTNAILKKDKKLMLTTFAFLLGSLGFFVASMLCKHTHDHLHHHDEGGDSDHERRLSQESFSFSRLAHDWSIVAAVILSAVSIFIDIFRSRRLYSHIDKCYRQTGALTSHVFADKYKDATKPKTVRNSSSRKTLRTARTIHSNFFDHHQPSFLRTRGLSLASRSESPPRRPRAAQVVPVDSESVELAEFSLD